MRDSRWEPPDGWIKCNFDSSYRNDQDFSGLGWIVRDDKGSYLASRLAKIRGVSQFWKRKLVVSCMLYNRCEV